MGTSSEYQTIPLNKIEDFGVHCKQYYSMDVTYFKSALDKSLLDSLWNHYWVNTLSSSSLLTNAEYTTGQISDLADKLGKATTDSCKITTEVLNGLMGQVIKDRLFNQTSSTSSCKPKPKDQASVEDLFKFKM